MDLVTGIFVFIIVVLIVEAVNLALRIRANPELKRIRKVLRALSAEAYRKEIVNITRKRSLSNIPWLNKGLLSIQARSSLMKRLDLFLQQADVTFPLAVFILLSIIPALIGFILAIKLSKSYVMAVSISTGIGIAPFLYTSQKRKQRMRKFERQFPDALDMIARALRAGHAFSQGMQIVAEEFDDPLGSEFENTVNQINYGISFQDALKSLSNRIDCPDLKLFAISIIIQRQSGGNLAEILENISYLIRERFKLRNKIRALSAEGKLSAIILISLPFFIALGIFLTTPEYIKILVTDPIGKVMIIICMVMMIIGVLVMKKIIAIKV
ncbi:MAG: type II secretion system F family protein [bacterium]